MIEIIFILASRHIFDERRVYTEVIDNILPVLKSIECGEDLLEIPNDTLCFMVSYIMDWPTKPIQHEFPRYANAKATIPLTMQLRLRQTDFSKAGRGNGEFNPCSIPPPNRFIKLFHPKAILKDANQ
jgi:hypothetical protein